MTFPILLRVLVTFTVLLVLTRISGKKQLSQSTFFEFVTAIAVGDIAGEKLADPEHPLLPWLGATLLWFGLLILMDLLVIKSRTLGKLIEGDPTILIENGRIQQKNLFSNFLRVDDLMAALRQKGFFSPADVEFAIFETDGTISVLPKSQARSLQPRDLQIATQYEGISQELIVDRQVIRANLKQTGLSEEWLAGELAKRGYQGPDEIFYAAIDTKGRLYADSYRDPPPRVTVKDQGPH